MHVLDLWFLSPLWAPEWCIFLKVTPSRYFMWFTSFGTDCSTGCVNGLVLSEGIGFLVDLSGPIFYRGSTWMCTTLRFLILGQFLGS